MSSAGHDLRRHQRKLFAAEPGRGIAGAATCRQFIGEDLEHAVAGGLAIAVVDRFVTYKPSCADNYVCWQKAIRLLKGSMTVISSPHGASSTPGFM